MKSSNLSPCLLAGVAFTIHTTSAFLLGNTRTSLVTRNQQYAFFCVHPPLIRSTLLEAAASEDENVDTVAKVGEETMSVSEKIEFDSEEEKNEAVGNLIADDEWNGLSMELSEIVRVAVVEDLKKNAREFLGKDEYKVGDISKEIDVRVKSEVANLRGKENYELGDFVLAMDELSKTYTEELTGKPYEAGDLSIELDKRVKSRVAEFCGKDEYEFGDLSREVSSRVQSRVEQFTGKPYEFGDVSREVNERRKQWVKDFLGDEAAENYEFGDVTKKFVTQLTGKDDYQFGDLSKKLVGDLFGKRKKKGD
jgi:hypothetical protein